MKPTERSRALVAERDPHRIRPNPVDPTEMAEYLTWHSDRLANTQAIVATITLEREHAGLPAVPLPSLMAVVAHHQGWVDRLTATLNPPPSTYRPPTPAQAEERHAATVAAYAHQHGLSIRQATDALRKAQR